MIFGREPAAIAAFIQAILALGVGFGLNLSTEQMGLLMAVVTLGLGLLVRQVVTPTAYPKLAGGSTVELEGSGTSVTLPEE